MINKKNNSQFITHNSQFKQTDIGRIPVDWNYDVLGNTIKEMTDFVASGSFESIRNNVTVFTNYNFAYYVRLYDLRLGLGHSKQKYLDKVSYKFLSKSNLFGNELLMANIGANVGETFLMPKISNPASIAPNMIVVKSNNEILNYKFLYFYTKSGFGIKKLFELIAGSGHPKINKTDLKQLVVLLPPLPEQEAIAQVLSDTDGLIGALEKRIAKKRLIKQGAMQTLLTPKDDWEVKKLGDFGFDISDGNYSSKYPKSSEFKTIGIPFIRANNIKNNTVIESDMRFISKELHSQLTKGHLKKDDILITTRGEIGQIAIVPEKFINTNINAQIVRINTNQKLDKYYFAYYLTKSETQTKLTNFQTGSALKQLPVGKLIELLIIFPPLPEQNRIATILSDMDSEIDTLETKLAKTKQLKQGLMQQLLTGKIRLV